MWFEAETIGPAAQAWQQEQLQLHRDGRPLQSGGRRFWDLRLEAAHAHLERNILDLIERCQIGYIKVDYNESVGVGADSASDSGDGPGEALRQHLMGSQRFFHRLKQRFPNLVVENCSSGGHRLEPSMLLATDMSSFSDAHEGAAIPIIAANLQRLVLPSIAQIWAVLRHADDATRLSYSPAATFLGRMCLSGDIESLDDQQWQMLAAATWLYRLAAPIIENERSYRPRSMTPAPRQTPATSTHVPGRW